MEKVEHTVPITNTTNKNLRKKVVKKITRIGDDHGVYFRFNSEKYNFWINQKYIYNFFLKVLQGH